MISTINNIRLTQTVKGAGCAAKLAPGDLDRALCGLDLPVDDNLLVGLEQADDAGVYKISDDLALVQTIDFFPSRCSESRFIPLPCLRSHPSAGLRPDPDLQGLSIPLQLLCFSHPG